MKIRFLYLSILALFISSCIDILDKKTNPIITNLDANDFEHNYDREDKAQLLDVRTPLEYETEHIHSAINVDYNNPNFSTEIKKLDTNLATYVYCLSGGRSKEAAKALLAAGFKRIYNLEGGILAWKNAHKPIESSTTENIIKKGLSAEEYTKLISGDTPVLIDFNATWCGPCKKLKPILEEIQNEKTTQIKIVPLDIDENQELATSMKISSIPLLIYYKNGEEIFRHLGFIEKQELINKLK